MTAGKAGCSRPEIDRALTEVFREEAGRMIAVLVRDLGDFALAEESVQDALLAALEHWSVDGIPERPGAWLFTVARRRALDVLRRDGSLRRKLPRLVWHSAREPDDRLRLIFTCCHPALSREAQVSLTLHAVCGLTTPQIARAFVTTEAAIAKRLVRARRKIVDAGIPYRMPGADEIDDRLTEALSVLYLMFNEGYLSSAGEAPERRELAADAAWLTELLTRLLPAEPEVLGLLALMRLHLARGKARFDADGQIVLLPDQDRALWDRAQIQRGRALLATAAQSRRTGPYQLQAAIVACHVEAADWDSTDWRQIVALYDELCCLDPSPVVRLNRAIAAGHVDGPPAALAALNAHASELDGYYLYHATRAQALADLGHREDAAAALRRALELTANPAEQSLLQRRLAALA